MFLECFSFFSPLLGELRRVEGAEECETFLPQVGKSSGPRRVVGAGELETSLPQVGRSSGPVFIPWRVGFCYGVALDIIHNDDSFSPSARMSRGSIQLFSPSISPKSKVLTHSISKSAVTEKNLIY